MTAEIELKLALAPDAVTTFLQLPILVAAGNPQRKLLLSRYFDTPALDLMTQRAALRVRSIGQQWVQTIKIGGTAINGLHSRPEWETPVPDDQPHPELFTEPSVHTVLTADIIKQLHPVFQTEFWRSTWLINFEDSDIEVALDQGEVSSQGRSAPICEVELELKSGQVDALTELARIFSQKITLTPDSISKAQRGYALYQTPAADSPA